LILRPRRYSPRRLPLDHRPVLPRALRRACPCQWLRRSILQTTNCRLRRKIAEAKQRRGEQQPDAACRGESPCLRFQLPTAQRPAEICRNCPRILRKFAQFDRRILDARDLAEVVAQRFPAAAARSPCGQIGHTGRPQRPLSSRDAAPRKSTCGPSDPSLDNDEYRESAYRGFSSRRLSCPESH